MSDHRRNSRPEIIGIAWTWPRKSVKRAPGPTLTARIHIGEQVGTIEITAHEAVFRSLGQLPAEDPADPRVALWSLVTNNELLERRSEHHRTRRLTHALHTAAWLGFPLLDWAKRAAKAKPADPLYQRVKQTYGSQKASRKGLAAFLLERNWNLAYGEWPSEHLPTDDPPNFYKILRRHKQPDLGLPKAIEKIVADILAGRESWILGLPGYQYDPDSKKFLPMLRVSR